MVKRKYKISNKVRREYAKSDGALYTLFCKSNLLFDSFLIAFKDEIDVRIADIFDQNRRRVVNELWKIKQ
jgi:hypothetical protein